MKRYPVLLTLALIPLGADADWTQARCEISPAASENPPRVLPCVFNQRQGYINIDSGDILSLDLEPVNDTPGEFRDQQGKTVIRHVPPQGNSQIFETDDGRVEVVWTALSARAQPGSSGFDETLVLQGISFRVSTPNASSINPVKIEIAGLELGPSVMEREADGRVTGAEVADLNADGSPELYVYTSSAGSGSYGNLIAFSVNNRKSASDIYLPPLDEAQDGYMGHDEFAIVEQALVRRFPLYRDGDTNAEPTGGTRQVQYRLVAGEAGWLLRPGRVADY